MYTKSSRAGKVFTVQLGYNSSCGYKYKSTFAARKKAVEYYKSLALGETYKARLVTPTGRVIARDGDSFVNPIRLAS